MTTLLGSKRWIAAVAAAGALVAVSGCAASDSGTGEPASSSSGTTSDAPTAAGPSAESTSPTTTPAPSAAATASPSATPAPARPADPAPSASPSSSPAVSSPAAAGTCTAAQLTAAVQDQLGGGAAGSVYRTLVLTNASDQGCTVAGYPGVSFVDGAGTQLGAPADRDGAASAPVLLAPGASAAATLRQTNAQNYGADCGLTPASGLRVYPPGATDSLVLPQEIPACSAASIVLMTVGPLQAAS
ncbi:DUF4232 domain-containing protein [Arthrobacter sp. TMS1-12-1]